MRHRPNKTPFTPETALYSRTTSRRLLLYILNAGPQLEGERKIIRLCQNNTNQSYTRIISGAVQG